MSEMKGARRRKWEGGTDIEIWRKRERETEVTTSWNLSPRSTFGWSTHNQRVL
jgi:hypothetical protein